jgi:hypothetical protein
MNGQPNVKKQIADGVKASEGHYKVDKLWGIPVACVALFRALTPKTTN